MSGSGDRIVRFYKIYGKLIRLVRTESRREKTVYSPWEGGCLAPEGSSLPGPRPHSTKALLELPWAWRMNSFSMLSVASCICFSDPCNWKNFRMRLKIEKHSSWLDLEHFHLPAGRFVLLWHIHSQPSPLDSTGLSAFLRNSDPSGTQPCQPLKEKKTQCHTASSC